MRPSYPAPPPRDVIEELSTSLRRTAEDAVPWFLDQMPAAYFQDTDYATCLAHLGAIVAARASGLPLEITLRSEARSSYTFIREKSYPGLLARLTRELPRDAPLRSAKVHGARDKEFVLDVFELGASPRFDPTDPAQADKQERILAYARELGRPPEEFSAHLARCSADYVLTVTPLRFGITLEHHDEVAGTEGVAVALEAESDNLATRILVVAGNAAPRALFERCASYLAQHGIDIQRGYLDVFDDVTLLSFVVTGPDGRVLAPDGELWAKVKKDLRRLRWVDERTLGFAQRHQDLGLLRAEVIVALASLAHQVLTRENPFAYSSDRVLALVERHIEHTLAIADLFVARFDPAGGGRWDPFGEGAPRLRAAIDGSVDLEEARRILATMIDAVGATLRTNLHVEARYALALRFDPKLLHHPGRDEIPYGAFFVHGASFDGFHVRFRDIARGGLRVVRPVGAEQHTLEADRLYDECFGLAYAQQLKNKDIPEGGAKAVVLVAPRDHGAEDIVARSVKAFTDALLDVLTPDPQTRRLVVDRFGKEEIVYLGPDENISPELIEWIVARAKARGYPMSSAFMSSKPGAGINHKTYGVTSEGVTVFLEVALASVGIDPRKQPFTVKLTGGPDGDVAGNEIRILAREYGDNARILGIADGSGCAEDPDGLDTAELLRLVDNEAPIAAFDRARLGPRGSISLVSEREGLKRRNTMHNRVVADAFVPSGGRPQTIHAGNWRQFLQADGTPSSRVIVEGANLFLTPDARRELSACGVVIVKDSSANKCGVICSSFEIAASMLLSEEEFLSIKPRFVEQVLQKLRALAKREAELLFREHVRRPELPLPEVSTRLSKIINRATDTIADALVRMSASDRELAEALVLEHLPSVLVDVARDRIPKLPRAYLDRTIATSLATRIVYREGLDWLEPLSDEAIEHIAVRYLRQERETARLIDAVRQSNLADGERVAQLLERSGTRAGLGDG